MLWVGLLVFVSVAVGVMWMLPGRSRRVARVLTLAGLCLALLVVLLLGEAALVLDRTVLSTSFHSAALEKANFPSSVPATAVAALDQQVGKGLKGEQRDRVLRLVEECLTRALSPVWVKAQLDEVLDQVLSYLRGRTPALEVSIDLRQPKAEALEFLAAAKIDQRVAGELKKMVSGIPDRISSMSLPEFRSLEEALGKCRPAVRIVSLAARAGGVLALVLALLVWLACGRSRAAAGCLGATLLVAGLGAAGLATVGEPWVMQQIATLQLPPVPGGLPLRGWLETEALGILGMERLVGLVTLACALVLLLLPRFVRSGKTSLSPGAPGGPSA